MDQLVPHTKEEFEDGGDRNELDYNPDNVIVINPSMSAMRYTIHVSSIVNKLLSFFLTVEDVLLHKVVGGNFGQSTKRVHNSRKLQATKSLILQREA